MLPHLFRPQGFSRLFGRASLPRFFFGRSFPCAGFLLRAVHGGRFFGAAACRQQLRRRVPTRERLRQGVVSARRNYRRQNYRKAPSLRELSHQQNLLSIACNETDFAVLISVLRTSRKGFKSLPLRFRSQIICSSMRPVHVPDRSVSKHRVIFVGRRLGSLAATRKIRFLCE